MIFNLSDDGTSKSISVFINGDLKVALNSHPRFDEIVAGAMAGDESIVDLFDTVGTLKRKLSNTRLSDRVAVRNNAITFDGDELHDVLADEIIKRLVENDEDARPLVNFLEKIQANQSESVRNGLYNWIKRQDLTITPSGNFLGFKGLKKDYGSITHGPGIVNDVEQNGSLDNSPGNVLEVARSYVNDDANVHCSTGLHVGTRQYATSFAQGKVVVCEVDPRNVVSVPNDGHEKIRCSKYVVIEDAAPEYGSVYSNVKINSMTASKTEPYSVVPINWPKPVPFNSLPPLVISAGGGGGVKTEFDSLGRPMPRRDKSGRFIKKTS